MAPSWVGQRTRHWVSAARHPQQGDDLNHRRTRAQLSLAVVIIPQPLSDRWHCGISDFMAGHLSYPISFPIWWEVLAPVKFSLHFEYWSDSALSLCRTPPHSLLLSLYRHLRQVSSDLMAFCTRRSVWDASARLYDAQHTTMGIKKKTWINMSQLISLHLSILNFQVYIHTIIPYNYCRSLITRVYLNKIESVMQYKQV